MKISSPSFSNNEMIPSKFTCDGENLSPALEIAEVPEGAKSLALIMDDPDAPRGTFDHWIMWNIPISETVSIFEGTVPEGSVQGRTGFGKNSYGGPCPPSGTHRYMFKVYALDTTLDLPEGLSKKEVEEAIKGHILGKGLLVGTYKR